MKTIIRFLFSALVMIAFMGTAAQAQNGNKQRLTREQLAEVQAKHIADTMALEGTTRDKFITTYCQSQKEVWALGPRPSKKANRTQSEQDAEQEVKERFAHSQKILDIREKYYAEYSKFLTPKQIKKVYELERQMRNRLMMHKKARKINRKG